MTSGSDFDRRRYVRDLAERRRRYMALKVAEVLVAAEWRALSSAIARLWWDVTFFFCQMGGSVL